ncbi:MAG: translocation/assembly module TamB domain-containing protein [Bacteroidales bacterium]
MTEIVAKNTKKRTWIKILLAITILLVGLVFALGTSPVQTFIARFFSNALSEKLGTKVEVNSVKITFFDKVVVEGFLMEDLSGDTLIYSDRLEANFRTISLNSKQANVKSLYFHNPIIGISIDSLNQANYKFLEVLTSKDSTNNNTWDFNVDAFTLNNGAFSYNPLKSNDKFQYSNINIGISNIHISKDSAVCKLDSLSLNDVNGFQIRNISGSISANLPKIRLDNLSLSSDLATVSSNSMSVDLSKINETGNLEDLILDCNINNSDIDLKNLGPLIHEKVNSNLKLSLRGKINGSLKTLKGSHITISTGKQTVLDFNFQAQNILNYNRAHLNFDINKFDLNLQDIEGVVLPSSRKALKMPEQILKGGVYKISGKVIGHINNFNANANIKSKFGNIATKLQVAPDSTGAASFNGNVKTYKLNIHKLLDSKLVDKLTFEGELNGTYNYESNIISTYINGTIDSFYINNYCISSVNITGNLDKNKYKGKIEIDDSNLKLALNGIIDRNEDEQHFDFKLDVEEANLDKLNLVSGEMLKSAAFELDAKIQGNDVFNYFGEINIDNGYLSSNNNTLLINDIQIKRTKGSLDNFVISSPFVDLFMNGTFRFIDIVPVFNKFIEHHLPNSSLAKKSSTKEMPEINFVLEAHFKKLDDIAQFITPKLHISDDFMLTSSMSSHDKNLIINTVIPEVAYGKTYFNTLSINGDINENDILSEITASKISFNNKYDILNCKVDANIYNNSINYSLLWQNDEHNRGNVIARTDFIETNDSLHSHTQSAIPSSDIFLLGKKWQLSAKQIEQDNGKMHIDALSFINTENRHSIFCKGIISDKDDEKIDLNINNIQVDNILNIFKINAPLNAGINGKLSIWSVLNSPKISSSIHAQEINFRGQNIGNLSFKNDWDFKTKNITADIKVNNSNKHIIDCDASFNLGTDSLRFDSKIDGFPLQLLELVSSSVFSRTKGTAYGNFNISGIVPDIKYSGALFADKAEFTIAATAVDYHFTDSILMNGNRIIFKDITAYDKYGDSANVDGYIEHSNFNKMKYDINISTQRICALNSTPTQNEIFYGDAFAEGRIKISGTGKDILISGNATTSKGTKLNMGLFHKSAEGAHSFIRFVEHNNDDKTSHESIFSKLNYVSETTGVGLNFNITATPEASMKIFYFNSMDDEIEAKGNGNLKIELNKYGDYNMAGTFSITEGYYKFSLKDLLTKTFKIKQGSTMRWSGSPQDANVDISAIYQIKTSISDLAGDNVSTVTRPLVDCYIILTGQLTAPSINFDIKFPTVDAGTTSILQQYLSTPDELNRQALSLLLLGRFYSNTIASNSAGSVFVNNTASELVTSSLSSMLSNINKNVNIGVVYRPNEGVIQDEFEVSMSTALLNDYVTISGNVGNTNNAYYLSNTDNNIVGEFDVSVKLTKDGNWLLKAFNHANNNFYDAAPYTQGVSLTFKHDFDLLIRRYSKKYKNKNREKPKNKELHQ